uniref:Putative secreted protein n=1 Tax=Amblyomma cajennense TaxID=34607 RepID=A0A023FCH3_AMBCJ
MVNIRIALFAFISWCLVALAYAQGWPGPQLGLSGTGGYNGRGGGFGGHRGPLGEDLVYLVPHQFQPGTVVPIASSEEGWTSNKMLLMALPTRRGAGKMFNILMITLHLCNWEI